MVWLNYFKSKLVTYTEEKHNWQTNYYWKHTKKLTKENPSLTCWSKNFIHFKELLNLRNLVNITVATQIHKFDLPTNKSHQIKQLKVKIIYLKIRKSIQRHKFIPHNDFGLSNIFREYVCIQILEKSNIHIIYFTQGKNCTFTVFLGNNSNR